MLKINSRRLVSYVFMWLFRLWILLILLVWVKLGLVWLYDRRMIRKVMVIVSNRN